jgi:hypothetical protein
MAMLIPAWEIWRLSEALEIERISATLMIYSNCSIFMDDSPLISLNRIIPLIEQPFNHREREFLSLLFTNRLPRAPLVY